MVLNTEKRRGVRGESFTVGDSADVVSDPSEAEVAGVFFGQTGAAENFPLQTCGANINIRA